MLKSENFYLLRAPYLPISYAKEILDNPSRTREIVTKLCHNEYLRQAVFLASPVLFNEIDSYLLQDTAEHSRSKVEQSLLKYIIRASSRSTPYGMFSGVSRGTIEDKTDIILTDKNEHVPVIRLDMQLLEIISQNISSRKEVQSKLKFYPNSSGYVINDRLNYFESQMLGRTKTFNLSSIEYTEYIDKIIRLAGNGATKDELRNTFDLDEFDSEEVDQFIDELIENEVIVHHLVPSLTCENALQDIIYKLESLGSPSLEAILNSLHKIKSALESPLQVTEKKVIVEAEIEFFGITNYDSDFFQVDLKLGKVRNQLKKSVVEEIISQTEEIASIMPNSYVEDLENFKNRYAERYESQEMPLTHVLDAEFGIGYSDSGNHTIGASVLIGDITNFKNSPVKLLKMDGFHKLKSEKFYHALRNELFEVEIKPDDIEVLKSANSSPSVLPDSCYLMGNLMGCSSEAIDKGNYTFKLDYFNGPSASTLLARFCHTEPDLVQDLKKTIKNEQAHKEAIYAEIVHSPQPRLGNVIHRPVLREYEIPLLSESGTPKDKCIDITDLMVSISDGQVVLRSKRLNKRVIPCLSSAQNFRVASLPIYKFLCDLQHQGVMGSLVWDWDAFRMAKFLPRVTYKKLILSPATWNIDKNSLKQYSKLINTDDLNACFSEFRKEFKIPDKVLLADGDNKLWVDLDNQYSLDIIFKHLQNNQYVTLVESFFSSDNCIVKDNRGEHYASEIIIPVSKMVNNPIPSATPKKISSKDFVQRTFSLGSEWMYVKIYGGTLALDLILKTKIADLIHLLEQAKMIDKWFFIRFNDPDNHIRLRFHLSATDHLSRVIELFNNMLHHEISNQTIYKIQFDTYQREVDRYGNDQIENCEAIFWRDSVSTVGMLQTTMVDNHEGNARWLFALQSMDNYFSCFKINIEERIKFTEMLFNSFCIEFGEVKTIKRDLDNLYRKNRHGIENHFNKSTDNDEFTKLLKDRKESLHALIEEMLSYYSQFNISGAQIPILPSIIHMSINRIFPVYQRKYEMIMYYFLNKHYKKIYYTTPVANSLI